MDSTQDMYLQILGLDKTEDAISKIKILSSGLSDEQHIIRSCIFDIHATIEDLLRELFKKTFSSHLFFKDNDQEHNESIVFEQEKALNKLSFLEIWRCLKPTMIRWSVDFKSIDDINTTRNLAAHNNIEKVIYKNRNPFKDKDCLAQMFFDMWAIAHEIRKYSYFTTEKDKKEFELLKKKYDELLDTTTPLPK